LRLHAFHAGVERDRPARRQPAAALDGGGLAHRRAGRRALRGRSGAPLARGPTRAGAALGRPPPARLRL
ncbi:MAG: hypothetical protein AVDCRST_MAG27-831, partial [uncultured Craurococcus sp.]